MDEPHQSPIPEIYFTQEERAEDYHGSQGWGGQTQVFSGNISEDSSVWEPEDPVAAAEADWQRAAHLDIGNYAPGVLINDPHLRQAAPGPGFRPYRSAPAPLYRQYNDSGPPTMLISNDSHPLVTPNADFQQAAPGLRPRLQSDGYNFNPFRPVDYPNVDGFPSQVTQALEQPYDVPHLDVPSAYWARQIPSRKRHRTENDAGTSILPGTDRADQTQQVPLRHITSEVKEKVILFFRTWFDLFSPDSLPKPEATEALATLTRLPPGEVNKLLIPAIQMKVGEDTTRNQPAESKAIELFRVWLRTTLVDTLPKNEDFRALAILTDLLPTNVERLLAQMLIGHTLDSFQTPEHPVSAGGGPARVSQSPMQESIIRATSNPRPPIFDRAIQWANKRDPQCNPARNTTLIRRNPSKKYQCTRGCGAAFKRKDDWRRHEEDLNYPQDGWICNLASIPYGHRTSCKDRQIKGRLFFRRDKFIDHCDKLHPEIDGLEFALESRIKINYPFPQHCGFCNDPQTGSWLSRCEHIIAHFDAGKDMSKWADPDNEDGGDGDQDDGDKEYDEDSQENDDYLGREGSHGSYDPANQPPQGPSTHPPDDTRHGSPWYGASSGNNTGSASGSCRDNSGFMITRKPLPAEVRQNQDARLERDAAMPDSAVPRSTNTQSKDRSHIFESSHTNWSTDSNINSEVGSFPRKELVHRPKPLQRSGKVNMNALKTRIATKFSFFRGNRTLPNEDKSIHNPKPEVGRISRSVTMFEPVESVGDCGFSSSSTLMDTLPASPLTEKLINARFEWPPQSVRYFIPADSLINIVTLEAIEKELKMRGFDDAVIHSMALGVSQDRRKIFAILALIGMTTTVLDFITEGVCDSDLPIRDLRVIRQTSEATYPKPMDTWPRRKIEEFCRVQWAVLAPSFNTARSHYELDDNAVLPFIKDYENTPWGMKTGGYSDVWPVKIHHAHQKIYKGLYGKTPEPLLAVKRLFSRDTFYFEWEKYTLVALTMKRHQHLMELLATYRYKGKYHLLFPYADSNLRQFWEGSDKPDHMRLCKWALEQMHGLASAVDTIHNYGFAPDPPPSLHPARLRGSSHCIGESSSWLYGRHGDLKPENILWTKGDSQTAGLKTDMEKVGLLRIADFGLARFHRLESRSVVDPKTVAGTAAYVPPEVFLERPISRAYDIWSLGCIFLEFITWLVLGAEGLFHFTSVRRGAVDESFFEITSKGVARGNVESWITNLRESERCSQFIHECLELILESMLVISPEKRIDASRLTDTLLEMMGKADENSDYLITPRPWTDNIHIMRMGTNLNTLEVPSQVIPRSLHSSFDLGKSILIPSVASDGNVDPQLETWVKRRCTTQIHLTGVQPLSKTDDSMYSLVKFKSPTPDWDQTPLPLILAGRDYGDETCVDYQSPNMSFGEDTQQLRQIVLEGWENIRVSEVLWTSRPTSPLELWVYQSHSSERGMVPVHRANSPASEIGFSNQDYTDCGLCLICRTDVGPFS